MDIDRARAIADVAKVIVDSAKVEVDFVKATGNDMASGFLPIAQQDQRPTLALKRGA
jgi:DNA-directed RNA polymerase subunit K/omega